MSLVNSWIGYVDRTVEQVKNNLFAKYQALVPEITDHTDSNVFSKMINIWLGLTEHLNYYIDNKGRETFLGTCRKYDSAVKIARAFDYRVKGRRASTVDVTFTLNIPATSIVLIQLGTKLKTTAGVEFLTTEQVAIGVGLSSVQAKAKQVTSVASVILGVSDGSINQKFELPNDVADKSVALLSDVEAYIPVETFAFSTSTSKVFQTGINESAMMEVRFGDGMNGFVPQAGKTISVTYNSTLGTDGNVGKTLINTIDSVITLPVSTTISVTNLLASSGGTDIESLLDIKRNVPVSHRTKLRAVTEDDYKVIAELVNGVGRALVDYKCTKDIPIYIAPTGGGVANQILLDDVKEFFEDKRLVGKTVNPIAVGEVLINIVANVNAVAGFQNLAVKQAIINDLLTLYSVENQPIKGTVYLSDVYESIENTKIGGLKCVNNSNVLLMSPIPFGRQTDGTETVLDWVKFIKPESTTTVKWNVRFTTINTYELRKNDIYYGTYSSDVELSFTEITFTILGEYLVNDRFEFYSYPYNSNKIEIVEPSIGVASLLSLNINVTGGV